MAHPARFLLDKYFVPDEDTRMGRKLVNVIVALEGVRYEATKADDEEEEDGPGAPQEIDLDEMSVGKGGTMSDLVLHAEVDR
jgi:hypothetical protein